MTSLYIKNMVSDQCMATVRHVLEGLSFNLTNVEPGLVEMHSSIDNTAKERIQDGLKKAGFALIDDDDVGRVNQIKCYIMKLIHHRQGERIDDYFSNYLSKAMGIPYVALNKLFIAIEEERISQYVMQQRVERAKKLLTEDWMEYNTTDISIDLGYNSPGALCADFKKITGVTLTSYRSVGMRDRKKFQS